MSIWKIVSIQEGVNMHTVGFLRRIIKSQDYKRVESTDTDRVTIKN